MYGVRWNDKGRELHSYLQDGFHGGFPGLWPHHSHLYIVDGFEPGVDGGWYNAARGPHNSELHSTALDSNLMSDFLDFGFNEGHNSEFHSTALDSNLMSDFLDFGFNEGGSADEKWPSELKVEKPEPEHKPLATAEEEKKPAAVASVDSQKMRPQDEWHQQAGQMAKVEQRPVQLEAEKQSAEKPQQRRGGSRNRRSNTMYHLPARVAASEGLADNGFSSGADGSLTALDPAAAAREQEEARNEEEGCRPALKEVCREWASSWNQRRGLSCSPTHARCPGPHCRGGQ